MRSISVNFKPDNTTPDFGPAAVLQWIDIKDLVIDDKYQRPLSKGNWAQIKKIADKFSWSMFSAVFVSPLEGGKYAIIDGQHRTHAALACGIDSVPCLVVNIDTAAQARAFAAVNGMTVKVSPLNIFHAEIAGGNEAAINLNETVNSCGFKIMRSQASAKNKIFGQLYGITILKKIIKNYNDDVLAASLLSIKYSEICTTPQDHYPVILEALSAGYGRHQDLCSTPTILADIIDDKRTSLEIYLDQAGEEAKQMRRSGRPITRTARLETIFENQFFARAAKVAA